MQTIMNITRTIKTNKPYPVFAGATVVSAVAATVAAVGVGAAVGAAVAAAVVEDIYNIYTHKLCTSHISIVAILHFIFMFVNNRHTICRISQQIFV